MAVGGNFFPLLLFSLDAIRHFYGLIKHCFKFDEPTDDDPALLILDGYKIHTKNFDFIESAREKTSRPCYIFAPTLHCTVLGCNI